MENRYGVMDFRQDLPGFGEPMDGMWDGFQRINTETKRGGIIGVFRQGAMETKRIITVRYLHQNKVYEVKNRNAKVIPVQTA